MTNSLPYIFDCTKSPILGLIHVGIHKGQEMPQYRAWGINNVRAYEPQPEIFKHLYQHNRDGVVLVNKGCGNINGELEMNIETENDGESCSVLAPKKYLLQYPKHKFIDKIRIPIVRLDDDVPRPEMFDVLNIDVQGYELEVMKGAEKMLRKFIKVVITEVNFDELYEGCALLPEMDAWLKTVGFMRFLTDRQGGTWGNAIYMKTTA